ncbi:hypothetical protein NFI96_004596 [Prochilodus magdalenae]|nr:hypothetical protein NFI96_004596 [Prochilodus magdalenae]
MTSSTSGLDANLCATSGFTERAPALLGGGGLVIPRREGCLDKQRVMGMLRQMEKFLKGQEIRFTEGLRIMKSKLASLQNSVSKFPQADQSSRPPQDPHRTGSIWVVDHSQHCSDTDVVVVC